MHIFPGLWKIDGYTKVAKRLQQRLKLVPGETYFEFPYDWRRDNRVAARKLKREPRPGSTAAARRIPTPRSSSLPTRWVA